MGRYGGYRVMACATLSRSDALRIRIRCWPIQFGHGPEHSHRLAHKYEEETLPEAC
jgi:hypothetical protein